MWLSSELKTKHRKPEGKNHRTHKLLQPFWQIGKGQWASSSRKNNVEKHATKYKAWLGCWKCGSCTSQTAGVPGLFPTEETKGILGGIWAQRLRLSCSLPITASSELRTLHYHWLQFIPSLHHPSAPPATCPVHSTLSCVQGCFTEVQSSTGSSHRARRYSAGWSSVFAWCDWPYLHGNTWGSQVCLEPESGHRWGRWWGPGPGTQVWCLPSAALLSGPSGPRTQGSPQAPAGRRWGRPRYSARWIAGSSHCHQNARIYSPRQRG